MSGQPDSSGPQPSGPQVQQPMQAVPVTPDDTKPATETITELADSVSADLKAELGELAPPLDGVPSEAEIRVAQAQLVGWLEGLFHGIQAAMFAQQMAARQQFEEVRRRGLLAQNPQQPEPQGPANRGQYL